MFVYAHTSHRIGRFNETHLVSTTVARKKNVKTVGVVHEYNLKYRIFFVSLYDIYNNYPVIGQHTKCESNRISRISSFCAILRNSIQNCTYEIFRAYFHTFDDGGKNIIFETKDRIVEDTSIE